MLNNEENTMNVTRLNNNSNVVIGIIAPSSPVPNGLVENSVAYFEGEGFRVKSGNNLKKRNESL